VYKQYVCYVLKKKSRKEMCAKINYTYVQVDIRTKV